MTQRSNPLNPTTPKVRDPAAPLASPAPIAPEFTAGADVVSRGSATTVRRETSVQTASESEVDSHLRSLTTTTSIEELTRAGKTHNLKTLSESDLKEWIKEALRRVISTTTSIGDAEREQLIAKTRTTLAAIMVERRAEGRAQDQAQDESAQMLAALGAERDRLAAQLAAAESKSETRVTDLQLQLSAALGRCETIAAHIPDLQARLAAALAAPVADPQELSDLRWQLGASEEEAATAGAKGDESKRISRDLMGRLVREREHALAEKTELAGRIAGTERAHADLDRRREDAERRAADAEASLAAAEVASAAAAELARSTERRVDLQRTDSSSQLKDAEASRVHLLAEVARVRAAAAAVQEQLAVAVRAAAASRAAAEQREREHSASTERERQLSSDAMRAADAGRVGAEHSLTASQGARAELAGERDRLATALGAAEVSRDGVDARLRTTEDERDAARRHASASSKRAGIAEKSLATQVRSNADAQLPVEVSTLQAALMRARAVVTDGDGAVREDVTGDLVARKPRRWMTAWRDPKGRLKVGRTVGDHWMKGGRTDGVETVGGLASDPVLLARSDGTFAAWRDTDGHARLVALDDTGRPRTAPVDLGPSLSAPGLSRGGGEAATFVVTTDLAGHVHLRDRDGAKPLDLTAALKAPPAAGGAAAWHWPLEGSRHITYRDADGAVHEYLELKGVWFHAALSARTGSPAAAADPIGYAPADHEHIVYLGVDGHVHELCFDAKIWHHNDLTASAGACAATGRPSGAYVAGRHCIVFRGVDGEAHCLRLRRDWRHHALSTLGPITEDPQLASSGSEGAVTFRGPAGERQWARFSDPLTCQVAPLPV